MTPSQANYIADSASESKELHTLTCSVVDSIPAINRLYFETIERAAMDGYFAGICCLDTKAKK